MSLQSQKKINLLPNKEYFFFVFSQLTEQLLICNQLIDQALFIAVLTKNVCSKHSEEFRCRQQVYCNYIDFSKAIDRDITIYD